MVMRAFSALILAGTLAAPVAAAPPQFGAEAARILAADAPASGRGVSAVVS
jgi:hypothetical protein